MSERWFFDDDNRAYMLQFDNAKCYTVFSYEGPLMRAAIDKLPITNIEIRHDIDHISVKFENKADEAYFKVLIADGIEI